MAHPYTLKGPGVAVLSGGSTGIGLAYAKQLAARGYDLVLLARRAAPLKEAKALLEKEYGVTVLTRAQDMGKPGAAAKVRAFVQEKGLDVAVVVNCAGFGDFLAFLDSEEERLEQMVQLNAVTVTAMTRAFAPMLVARGGGAVITISSTAAFMPLPNTATYAATKAYVNSLTVALAAELRDKGVAVQAVCPGPMGEPNQLDPGPVNTLMDMARMSSDDVAKAGIKGYERGEVLTIPGAANAVSAKLAGVIGGENLARAMQFALSRFGGG